MSEFLKLIAVGPEIMGGGGGGSSICSGPFAGGILAMPLAGTYKMPTGGIGTWYAPRGHTRIADKDAKLL